MRVHLGSALIALPVQAPRFDDIYIARTLRSILTKFLFLGVVFLGPSRQLCMFAQAQGDSTTVSSELRNGKT